MPTKYQETNDGRESEISQAAEMQRLAKFLKQHGYDYEMDGSNDGFIYFTIALAPDLELGECPACEPRDSWLD